jgi:protein gp37
MGEKTDIAWTEKTWNPWHGCHKISPGCKFCYMFREKRQYGQDPDVVVRSKTTFSAPLKWKEPALIFTCSWSDWFIEEADAWRGEAYEIIRATPHHVYQILTKRSERMAAHMPQHPLPNVWWGVSCEDRKYGLPRIEHLRAVGGNRFVSFEPLLEDLGAIDLTGIGWAIPGGESGPQRRTLDVEWIASLVRQCEAQGVPCFVKQDSGFKSGQQGRIPDDLFVRQFPPQMVLR